MKTKTKKKPVSFEEDFSKSRGTWVGNGYLGKNSNYKKIDKSEKGKLLLNDAVDNHKKLFC